MITAVGLFAGIGGIDIAFRQAGFEVILANEIDQYACATYRNNFTNALSEANIKSVDEKTVPESDVLFGGFPCQSYPEFRIICNSAALERKRDFSTKHAVRCFLTLLR